MPGTTTTLQAVADAGLGHWDAAPFLKKVTDIVPSIIYIFNQATQSNEYSNHSLADSLGYSPQEAAKMGAAFLPTICHPEDLPLLGPHFEAIQNLRDGDVIQLEYRVRHKEGHWVWLLSYDTVFDRDSSGKVIRHIGVASDISVQKHAEEQARAESRKVQLTSEELGAFSYSLSHDMKAPANTLDMLLNEVLETHVETLDPDAIELLNMALLTVGKMNRLVTDVQNYTGVINQDLNRQNVPLRPLLLEVIETLTSKIQTHNAQIFLKEMPTVAGDPAQLALLFRNLIENAIIFKQPRSTPKIEISASDLAANRTAITVRDNGMGIDAAKHERIFTIFQRLNTGFQYSGAGLGLAICRRIASNHDSDISLVSAPGAGSAFTIGLERV